MNISYKYLFGPVPSRRLGVSLGVDLIPYKTCSYDCVYCECDATTCLTTTRQEYVPTKKVITELDAFLASEPYLDNITFSGSGEPTLHSGIGFIAENIASSYPDYQMALLTNGSLFSDPVVREDVLSMDIIIPSLDAATDCVFEKINRPHSSITTERVISGLEALRDDFAREMWLEIFIIPGLNDTDDEIQKLHEAILRIRPDRVQLNTLDRPGVESWVQPATQKHLLDIASRLNYPSIEVIQPPDTRKEIPSYSDDLKNCILQTIQRRPCTVLDLCDIFSLHQNEVNKYIGGLLLDGLIREKREERGIFFVAVI